MRVLLSKCLASCCRHQEVLKDSVTTHAYLHGIRWAAQKSASPMITGRFVSSGLFYSSINRSLLALPLDGR
eukprot:4997702-Amphidinium_carterae.1